MSKRCPKTKKTRYPNQRRASIGMMRVISHTTTDMFDLHTYYCKHCLGWHFGHKSYYEMELKKQQIDTVSS